MLYIQKCSIDIDMELDGYNSTHSVELCMLPPDDLDL